MVPNYRTDLLLEAAKVEGEGNRAQIKVVSLDILAFDVSSGRPIPLTLLGLPLPADGSIYAILNRTDKSRTLLDGTRFWEYKAFVDFVYAERDRAAKWATGEGVAAGLAARESASEGGDSFEPGSGLVGGLLSPVPAARWK